MAPALPSCIHSSQMLKDATMLRYEGADQNRLERNHAQAHA